MPSTANVAVPTNGLLGLVWSGTARGFSPSTPSSVFAAAVPLCWHTAERERQRDDDDADGWYDQTTKATFRETKSASGAGPILPGSHMTQAGGWVPPAPISQDCPSAACLEHVTVTGPPSIDRVPWGRRRIINCLCIPPTHERRRPPAERKLLSSIPHVDACLHARRPSRDWGSSGITLLPNHN